MNLFMFNDLHKNKSLQVPVTREDFAGTLIWMHIIWMQPYE